jgi:hypothetical protein
LLAAYGLRGLISSVSVLAPTGTLPYTSSVEIWTKRRRRVARLAASSSAHVPSTSVRMKSPAAMIDRSTCVSAAKCTTIRNPGQEDLRGRPLSNVLLHELRDALVEQVVAQVHHERVGSDEALTDFDGVRQASWSVLLDVGDAHAPARSVADRGANLRLGVADEMPMSRIPASAMASMP